MSGAFESATYDSPPHMGEGRISAEIHKDIRGFIDATIRHAAGDDDARMPKVGRLALGAMGHGNATLILAIPKFFFLFPWPDRPLQGSLHN